VIEATQPRLVFQQGVNILTSLALLYVPTCVFLVVGLVLALDLAVLKRISLLAKECEAISPNSQTSSRVTESGTDEIGSLGSSINAMLMNQESTRDALIAHAAQLQEFSKAKSAFLANMSHEVRTPLSGILGLTQIMLDAEITEDQSHMLQLIQRSGDALVVVINDILDYSKIEAKKLELTPTILSLRRIVLDVFDIADLRRPSATVEIAYYLDPKLPEYSVGDDTRFRQVLWNLVGNALKFTHNYGVVIIVAELKEETEGAYIIECNVADSGIGIPAEKVSTIFEAFTQADSSTTRTYGGTGLGLAIAKQLVELMGGQISVKSKVGVGSRFTFTLSVGKHTEAAQIAPLTVEQLDLSGKRVLVVDDNLVNQTVVTKLLAKWGANITTAVNGLEAITLHAAEKFDLILMDCQMPIMNGFEAAVSIRKAESQTGNRVPIVAMTASAMTDERNHCFEVGMDAFVSKPFKKAELIGAIKALVEV
jgi:signal transduction histidine kinase/CheY-like chemotaxis protein